MHFNGSRYMTEQTIKNLTNGSLAKGTDLTFKRDVLLYTFQETDELAHHEAMRWITKASRMSDGHFMRILDTGSDNGTLFVVLQAETGSPLSDRLNDLKITGHKALAYVYELAEGIRETRRNRLQECSVDADNLWMEDNGRLRILNFWKEGNHGRRGVPGLALLLYQMGAQTDIPTSSLSAYAFEMNRLFADLSEAFRERAVALACKAYEGACTLADFQAELEVLLGIGGESKARNLTAAERKQEEPLTRDRTVTAHKQAQLGKRLRASIQLRRWQLFATAGFSVLVLLLWLSLRPSPAPGDGPNPQTASPAAAPLVTVVTPKPTATASQAPAATAEPAASAPDTTQDAGLQQPEDEAAQVKAGTVPDLVAHTREEAEQMAKAAGLRYQFFLETNAAAKGVVFKQDLSPGADVKKGERITFWVSKGQ